MEEASIKFTHGKPLRGWLRKQGGKMRGWQRRFFVLYDSCLFYFNREDDTQMSNTYCVHEYHLKDIPASQDEPDKFAFELVPDRGNGDSVLLSAASDTEKKEWMKALCYNMYAEKGGAIFGLPLELAMEYEHKRGRQIPYVVEACIQHLEKFALETEGIFRLAGRAGLLRELRAQFEMARRPSLDDIDVHTVGSLLKAYLRELPESLVPPDMYQRIMNCAMRHAETSAEESRKAEVVCLSTLLEELPDINYTTLAYICRFLHRLAANSDKTKMTGHNLALVFGPNLIRHLDSSPELLMLTADLTQHLAYMMISHCPEVLPPRPQREAVPAGAMGSPFLRKKQQGGMNNVATADLLRMSAPLDVHDPKLLAPRPTALRTDLLSLDLFSSHSNSSSRNQSPNTPPSPFLFINDYFDQTDKKVSERLQEMRLGESGDSSDMAVVMRPVAPRRFKSRSMRTRRSGGTPSSPKSPDSPRHLDSQDILVALASASQAVDGAASGQEKSEEEKAYSKFLSSAKYGPALKDEAGGEDGKKSDIPGRLSKPGNRHTTIGRSHSSYAKVCNGKFTIETKATASEAHSAVSSEGGGRLRPSEAVLEAQVTALKSELANVKARSEHMVTALKNQLTDIRSKYEARISSLEAQQQREVVDLTAKLDAERTARAEAVEKTVSLQSQLHRYRLQYGDLSDA